MGLKTEQNNNFTSKFSVLICVYNNDNPEHFDTALKSIIDQTLKPDEIVLVIDGPIPNSIETVINIYKREPSFKVIRLIENVGHGQARRIGLENCSNELVALMDADDISVPNRFEKQVRCFEENMNISIVGGNIKEFVGNIDNIVGIRKVPQEDMEINEYMKKRCPFNQVTVMFKKTDVLSAGGYKDWYQNEDYYLWIRMYLCNYYFKNINDSLVYVRVGKEMYKRRGGWKYFISEAKLQKYMWEKNIIGFSRFFFNVFIRFVIQVLMPYRIRGIVFRVFARKKVIKRF